MTWKIKYAAIFSIISLALILNSCRKNQPACRGNCINISISGNVYVKTSGTALANVPVEVNWFRKGYCIGCTSYKVASGKSGNDGKFNFNTTIDSTFFRDYYLSVRAPTDTNYIAVPGGGGVHFNEASFYDFNSTALQNIKFESYPRTFLTIRLHRILNDNFNYFSVDHNFITDFGYGDCVITGNQFARDSIFKVETSADIFTRINWKKTIIGGQSIQQTDSLLCTKNGTNVFNIDY